MKYHSWYIGSIYTYVHRTKRTIKIYLVYCSSAIIARNSRSSIFATAVVDVCVLVNSKPPSPFFCTSAGSWFFFLNRDRSECCYSPISKGGRRKKKKEKLVFAPHKNASTTAHLRSTFSTPQASTFDVPATPTLQDLLRYTSASNQSRELKPFINLPATALRARFHLYSRYMIWARMSGI